jgi:hypothetical protein
MESLQIGLKALETAEEVWSPDPWTAEFSIG